MSYILDALKKSSEERRKLQEEEQQSPLPLGDPVNSTTHRRYRYVKLLVPTIVLILCATGWWFYSYPEKTGGDSAHQEPTFPTQHELKTAEPNSTVIDGVAEKRLAGQPATVQRQGPAGPDNQGKPRYPTSGSELPLLEELPLSFQAQLPEMKYSGHVFSPNPELRMIMINTTVVREGDVISPDLRLKEITSEGLTMSHNGTDFRVKLF